MQDNELKNGQTVPPQDEAAQQAPADAPELPDLDLSAELAKAQAKAAENYDLYVRAVAEHNGMKCENPVGLKFDPNTMQAITMVKDPAVQPGCVATVFQRGWKIADRVLRPAMVAVAQ